jgi:hypothetical protein
MGKGIEDISHFFMSMAEPAAAAPDVPKRLREEPYRRESHRVMAVLSGGTPGSGLPAAARLATALSHEGKKILLMDIGSTRETLESVLRPLQIQPSLNDLLNQSDKAIVHATSNGYQVLSFQLQEGELETFKPEEREILFQMLCREEQHSDVFILHIEFDPFRPGLLFPLRSIYETAVVVSTRDLLRAYGALKFIYHMQPEMRVGLIDAGAGAAGGAGLSLLVEGARKFLGKSPVAAGTLPRRAESPESPPASDQTEPHRAPAGLASELLGALSGKEDRHLFFERIEAELLVNRRGSERGRS